MKDTAHQAFLAFAIAIAGVISIGGCSNGLDQSNMDVNNNEWIVVVAKLPENKLLEVGREVQKLISRNAATNDVVTIIEAPSLETICSIVVPDGNPNARLRHADVRPALPKIKKLFKPTTGHGARDEIARVRLPDIAAIVSSQRRTEFPCRMIICGSPLYSDPRHAGWIMKNPLVPSDGSLVANSPFNVDGEYPTPTQVSWLEPGTLWGGETTYEQAVMRFNRLLLQKQNATLVRSTSDTEMAFVFDNLPIDAVEVARDEPSGMKQIHTVSKRTMPAIEVEPVEVPIVQPQVEDVEPVGIRDVVPKAEVTAPVVIMNVADTVAPALPDETSNGEEVLVAAEGDPETIALAIVWTSADPKCDLDMWVSSAGLAGELNHRNKLTSFGELYRDVLASGSIDEPGADYQKMEWVKISHDRLQDVTLWLNIYQTSKPSTVRIIRVWKGERKEKTITLNCNSGDRGVGNRYLSQAWKKIDLTSF